MNLSLLENPMSKRCLDTLVALKIKNKLAGNPIDQPRYGLEVKNSNDQTETLADPRATRALVALMNQHAVIGGAACHWGGPAAFAEMMSSLHAIMFRAPVWHETYNFVNDAGHAENGVYALRANYGFDGMSIESIKGFRSIDSKLTGHGEAHLNPEGVFVSNGPLGSGLPQAQGLALADKIIGNSRVTVCTISDGASMEGEAKEAMAAIPGMAKRGELNPFVMLISFNNTKLSGRIEEDSFDMTPSFNALETLGWEVIWVEEGHNLDIVHPTIDQAIKDASGDSTKPIAVIFKTIKGFGIRATEEAASGGHGYPLKAYDPKLPDFIQELYQGEAPSELADWAKNLLDSRPESPKKTQVSAVKKEKVQPGFARAAIAAAKSGLPVFSVTADLQGSTGIAAFHKEFPNRYVDVGVAESNMISTAVGLSKQGLIPIVDTFAQFAISKGNLPLIMAGLSGGPVIGLFSHTGFQDAADGASHQSTTYLAATSALPYTTTITCACSKEAEAYMTEAIKRFKIAAENGDTPESYLFYFGRENHPEYYKEDMTYEWGKAQVLEDGGDVVIATGGPLVAKALMAAEQLRKEGIKATVINNCFANKTDLETFRTELAKAGGKLVTAEDHQLIGGMGAHLSHSLSMAGIDFKIKSLAIGGTFGQSAYLADHLYAEHQMDDQAIIKAVKELL